MQVDRCLFLKKSICIIKYRLVIYFYYFNSGTYHDQRILYLYLSIRDDSENTLIEISACVFLILFHHFNLALVLVRITL
jgi:hypothetical protein